MKRIVYRVEAIADVEEASGWYESQRPGLGREFSAALKAAEDAVRKNPLAYPAHRRDVRWLLLHRFPYRLLYRVAGDLIVIVACYHVRRSPQTLQTRR